MPLRQPIPVVRDITKEDAEYIIIVVAKIVAVKGAAIAGLDLRSGCRKVGVNASAVGSHCAGEDVGVEREAKRYGVARQGDFVWAGEVAVSCKGNERGHLTHHGGKRIDYTGGEV